MVSVDLNSDMGESFGAWIKGRDAEILQCVSSANIACGFHAGDPGVIRKTIELAIENRVAVGAHPSFPDLQGFGRRSMSLSTDEVHDAVLYQVAALSGICGALGGSLHHVKPHGALYNEAAVDKDLARAIVEAVRKIDPGLIIYGLSGSFLVSEAVRMGLTAVSEVFADRTYRDDGTLTPRTDDDALIREADRAAAQAMEMVSTRSVVSVNGKKVPLKAETICIHGDGENAVEFAECISRALSDGGIDIKAP